MNSLDYRTKASLVWGVVALAAFLLIRWQTDRVTPPAEAAGFVTAPRPDRRVTAVRKPALPLFPGRTGRVGIAKVGWVPLARSRAVLQLFLDACRVNDQEGQIAALFGGEMFRVDRDTRVLILETAFLVARVRVLEGEAKGQAGWLPAEMVRVEG